MQQSAEVNISASVIASELKSSNLAREVIASLNLQEEIEQ